MVWIGLEKFGLAKTTIDEDVVPRLPMAATVIVRLRAVLPSRRVNLPERPGSHGSSGRLREVPGQSMRGAFQRNCGEESELFRVFRLRNKSAPDTVLTRAPGLLVRECLPITRRASAPHLPVDLRIYIG